MRTPNPAAEPRRRHRVGWSWILLTALAVAVLAPIQYLGVPLARTATGSAYAEAPLIVRIAFYAHISCGGLALLLGPWQFARWVRRRWPQVHRAIGWTSTVAIVIGGTAALVMAPFNNAGLVGVFGFGTIGLLWPIFTVTAVRAVRRGDLASHQAWMIRAFALTYAAVTLRLLLLVLLYAQLPFLDGPNAAQVAQHNAYLPLPFISWLPNLVVAELIIRRCGLPGLRIVPAPAVGHGIGGVR